MKPLRILMVTLGYKPAYRLGGPIATVAALAEGMVGRGHHVTVFATNSNLDEDLNIPTDQAIDVNGVEVWYFRRWNIRIPFISPARTIGFLYSPRMYRALEARVPDFDLVHTQMPFIYPTLAASRIAERNCKPLFYHQRGVLSPERLQFRGLKKRIYMSLFERPILRRATCLVALTQHERRDYGLLAPGVSCRVIPNGVDCHQFRVTPQSAEVLGIPPEAVVITFMGRLHPIKGADILLESFLMICERYPEAHLVLAGPDEWGVEATYKLRASRYAQRIHFPGMISGELKIEILARTDLFCLPSIAEGFSMAVLEAMASGAAVLLSPGCRFPVVVDADAGVIAENSVPELSVALERLLAAPAVIARMGANARLLVEREYRWDVILDGMESVYREFIDSGVSGEPRRGCQK